MTKPMPRWLADNWDRVVHLPLAPDRPDCEVMGCHYPAEVRGLCRPHFLRARRHWDPAWRARRRSARAGAAK